MADLTITDSDVLKDPTVQAADEDLHRTTGEVIDAGEIYYLDTDNSSIAKLAQHDGTDLEAAGYAMAVNSAPNTGQTIDGVREGLVTIGTHGQTIGTPFFVSANPGKIAPLADVGLGTDKTKLVGVIATATKIYISLKAPPAYPTS